MNDATQHKKKFNDTWNEINKLVGKEIEFSTSKDGSIVWKVVPSESVTLDQFSKIRQNEESIFNRTFSILKHDNELLENTSDQYDLSKLFWKMFPSINIADDIVKINEAIETANSERKKNFQRTIKKVTKSEYITFIALVIGSICYKEKGERLFNDKIRHKKKRFAKHPEFNKYMHFWRFKEIKTNVPHSMESMEMKAEGDDWWRFKQRVNDFNSKHQCNVNTSHVYVFDESMSAFIPRCAYAIISIYYFK